MVYGTRVKSAFVGMYWFGIVLLGSDMEMCYFKELLHNGKIDINILEKNLLQMVK